MIDFFNESGTSLLVCAEIKAVKWVCWWWWWWWRWWWWWW